MENKEMTIVPPEGYEIDVEKSTFEKIVFKKVETLPKTWEEFCENNPVKVKEAWIHSDSRIITVSSTDSRNRFPDRDRNILSFSHCLLIFYCNF